MRFFPVDHDGASCLPKIATGIWMTRHELMTAFKSTNLAIDRRPLVGNLRSEPAIFARGVKQTFEQTGNSMPAPTGNSAKNSELRLATSAGGTLDWRPRINGCGIR